jgi:hypothetical protein
MPAPSLHIAHGKRQSLKADPVYGPDRCGAVPIRKGRESLHRATARPHGPDRFVRAMRGITEKDLGHDEPPCATPAPGSSSHTPVHPARNFWHLALAAGNT